MPRSDQSGASQRRYIDVAYGILASIGSGELQAGQRLPAERELALAKGVSRQTVREALLVLELIGAISIRHGDGIYVAAPTAPVIDSKDAVLRGDPRELIESRRLLEPITTRMAAERATGAEIAALRDLLRDTDEGVQPAGLSGGVNFHAELAACSGNMMLSSVVSQLVNIEQHPLWRLINAQALRLPGARESQRAQHHAILQAVADRDLDRAESEMREHLEELQAYIFSPGQMFLHPSEIAPMIELPASMRSAGMQ
jgi:GntR family uxuAB operon transcriptional repressor